MRSNLCLLSLVALASGVAVRMQLPRCVPFCSLLKGVVGEKAFESTINIEKSTERYYGKSPGPACVRHIAWLEWARGSALGVRGPVEACLTGSGSGSGGGGRSLLCTGPSNRFLREE